MTVRIDGDLDAWTALLIADADTYGHLIPGVGEQYVNRLDAKTTPQQSAAQAQSKAVSRWHA
jgi:hypothetical protein